MKEKVLEFIIEDEWGFAVMFIVTVILYLVGLGVKEVVAVYLAVFILLFGVYALPESELESKEEASFSFEKQVKSIREVQSVQTAMLMLIGIGIALILADVF